MNGSLPSRSKPAVAVRLLVALLLLMGAAGPSWAQRNVSEQQILERVERSYGKAARSRLEALTALVERKATGATEMEKLRWVNDFFNRVPFVDDQTHWSRPDYWATPVEKLASNGGDCEDFAIAKYFALTRLGIPESKLRITYTESRTLKQAHMVTTYYPRPRAVPLVLDNINRRILPATARKDLVPVYSFNGTNLWLAKSRGTGGRVGDARKLSNWKDLVERMEKPKI